MLDRASMMVSNAIKNKEPVALAALKVNEPVIAFW